jgi:hypothetical protein
MSTHNKTILHTPPVVDEWGIYDPDRAGLAAVFERLEAKYAGTRPPNDGRDMLVSMRKVDGLRTRE